MLRLLIAIILGITLADCVSFPLWSLAVGFVMMVGAAWIWRRRAMGDIYVLAAAALVAMIRLGVLTSRVSSETAQLEVFRLPSARTTVP